MTYIEADYREIEFQLPYSEKTVSIPHNVVIFATMNPYDKSVVDLDSAMERRFDVIELAPSVELLKTLLSLGEIQNEKVGKVIAFFQEANKLAPHGFGHTYFKGVSTDEDFALLWNHRLKFIFEKMFRFDPDSYKSIRQSYIEILTTEEQPRIS